ncbi:hypothetical protein KOI35_21570 [Actinoplanes bogorensis]|uniref:Uncharacterized protein n=1 Tax=Paractinoplanes bogorensis TaxID=1610840 RepID=A0ABS5YTT3_9ACTN|nr:hypothetical protein [Actinoplanes bogorensis]MBU2666108.1 hypothetical protein [Actinoplanes bogorensis]
MSVGLSDAVFTLTSACVHSLRFSFGAPLGYPYGVPLSEDAGQKALFKRIQAASPPPTRGGQSWPTGMKLAGQPFQPESGVAKLAEVVCEEGIPSLDEADPGSIVLDEWFRIGRREETVKFPGDDQGRYTLSIKYWSPIPDGQASWERTVSFFDDIYCMTWKRELVVGEWVAISFDAFWPAERDSADVLIPIAECDEHCTA